MDNSPHLIFQGDKRQASATLHTSSFFRINKMDADRHLIVRSSCWAYPSTLLIDLSDIKRYSTQPKRMFEKHDKSYCENVHFQMWQISNEQHHILIYQIEQ